MAATPSTRTVTFLFSDIEGSTELARRLGDDWSATLGLHRDLLRAAFRTHGGRDVGTEGDSFFVVFQSAVDAASAAVDAQRALARATWPADASVRVRMGIHTGEARVVAGQYEGLEVHRAARIAAAGHGGQVLLSSTAVAVLGRRVPEGVGLRALGAHRLKDLPEPEGLQQLVIEGLPADFPPLRSLGSRRTDLPKQLTSFVGRAADVEAIENLVSDSRLVTLTGPGGMGKTRLALHVAGDLVDRFDDGASFVPLAPVADPALVVGAIAQVLEIRDVGEQPLEVTLSEWLRARKFLLVLDNFEHVLPAAPIVSRLLTAAEGLRVVATSREVLHLGGEQEYAVPPLTVPETNGARAPDRLLESDAVRLFVERARAVDPNFRLTDDNAATVLQICRRLDGLPLAIELASARLRILSPEALLERLGRSLDVLGTGVRDLPARQQTLRGAIAWSERLLDVPEQRLFRRLAVFRGGWTIEAAEAVAGQVGDLGIDVFEGISSLADKSLIRPVARKGEPRFLMLETIREYGLERLAAERELEGARRAHAAFFAALAAEARDQVEGAESAAWLDRLDRETGNLRAALDWLLEHDVGPPLEMGADLWRFWQRRGHLGEGRRWLERAAALPAALNPTPSRGRVLAALGSVAYWQNDFERARSAYEGSLAVWRQLGDDSGLQDALYNLGFMALVEHRFQDARDAYAESLLLAERLGEQRAVGRLQFGLAMTALVEGKLEEARQRYEETIRILEPLGDEFFVWTARRNIVEATTRSGDLAMAAELNREVAMHAQRIRDLPMLSMAYDDFATISSMQGHHGRAVRLAGAAAAVKERAGGGAPLPLITVVDVRAAAVERLSADEIERYWQEGRALDEEAAYALATED